MTDDEAGARNATSLVEECCENIEKRQFELIDRHHGWEPEGEWTPTTVTAVLEVLKRRGLLTEQALKLLEAGE